MTTLDHLKKLILREHDVKKTTLKKIKYRMMTVWDVTLVDIYKENYTEARIKEACEKGYPILLEMHGVTRLLIFNRPLC